jgi:hypothetical protein
MRTTCARLLLFCAVLAGPASAHEFWFKPVDNPQRLNSSATLQLEVGQYFVGDLVGFSKAAAISFQHFANGKKQDLSPLLPLNPVATVPLRLTTPGTHMVSFEGQPSLITLPADTFHAYLHDEGMDYIKAQREAAGTLAQPGRERYRRCVKTLIEAEGTATPATSDDTTFSTLTGMRLEIVPLNNPLKMKPGDLLTLRVLFEQKVLPGALVKAWQKRSGETVLVRATTGSNGEVSIHLPYAGAWMVSIVHMVPTVGEANTDWDSFWGNLSFSLP